jgi:hypothetical protein
MLRTAPTPWPVTVKSLIISFFSSPAKSPITANT